MNPGLAHYQLLRRLRQDLRHRGDFGLIYLFSDYPLANQWLARELDAHLRARSLCLQLLQPSNAALNPRDVVQPLLSASAAAAPMPYWLALSEPDPSWDAYRDSVLARLNESRGTLRRIRVFLFVVLPVSYEGRAADIAPDLWSVRSASHRVAPWSDAVDTRVAIPAHATPEVPGPWPLASLASLDAQLARWSSQWEQWQKDRDQAFSPELGWLLVEQLLERQQLRPAHDIALQALAVSRQLKSLTGDAPQSLRDLSVSLDNVGDVARDLGQLEEARAAYEEALSLLPLLPTRSAPDGGTQAREAYLRSELAKLA